MDEIQQSGQLPMKVQGLSPSGIKWYTGGYPGGTIVGYGPTLAIFPTVSTTFTAVIETCGSGAATDDVTVTVVDPEFNYPSTIYCGSDPGSPHLQFLSMEERSLQPRQDLFFISTSTGQVDLSASTPGTYSITYTINSPCLVSQNKTMTIVGIPVAPVALTPIVSRCGPGEVTFSVIQGPGTQILWYDAPTGGNLYPFTGASVTTNITATTFFYAVAVSTLNNCSSLGRTEIQAIVKPIPAITNTL